MKQGEPPASVARNKKPCGAHLSVGAPPQRAEAADQGEWFCTRVSGVRSTLVMGLGLALRICWAVGEIVRTRGTRGSWAACWDSEKNPALKTGEARRRGPAPEEARPTRNDHPRHATTHNHAATHRTRAPRPTNDHKPTRTAQAATRSSTRADRAPTPATRRDRGRRANRARRTSDPPRENQKTHNDPRTHKRNTQRTEQTEHSTPPQENGQNRRSGPSPTTRHSKRGRAG